MAQRLRFIDIGANLSDDMFKGMYNGKQYHPADLPMVLSRAWNAGVDRIIVTGGSLEESKQALEIAQTDDRLFCTVGVHPTRCKEFEARGEPDKHLKDLLELARHGCSLGKVVAIGECGLDYDRLKFCPADVQRRYFEKQFYLAEVTGLPMFLHMRAAATDFCEIIQANQQRFPAGVVHSFTGTADERDRLLGFEKLYIGINGCSLKTKENLEVMAGIPVERMMMETDSPYCEIKAAHAGVEHVTTHWVSKKKERHEEHLTVKSRNEPCHIRQVFEVIAGFRKVEDTNGIAEILYKNTCSVFFPDQ
ncbi:putative deoxyribonuclease TATDN1 [Selaginella moellendorffii]|uniref:putative deoxyribonuclease TATDN1 n=1 Tax=Selaginella moellendorffii TaxID=88036 RepID=UPI000D1D097B|nr:putative deoxyribonuclease TATDN1 [Selaginella moellendorffii]|eukprot:XP_002987836.2 putative deoxyribonuclease TATDN1 [Selaginella moellendorffii]